MMPLPPCALTRISTAPMSARVRLPCGCVCGCLSVDDGVGRGRLHVAGFTHRRANPQLAGFALSALQRETEALEAFRVGSNLWGDVELQLLCLRLFESLRARLAMIDAGLPVVETDGIPLVTGTLASGTSGDRLPGGFDRGGGSSLPPNAALDDTAETSDQVRLALAVHKVNTRDLDGGIALFNTLLADRDSDELPASVLAPALLGRGTAFALKGPHVRSSTSRVKPLPPRFFLLTT